MVSVSNYSACGLLSLWLRQFKFYRIAFSEVHITIRHKWISITWLVIWECLQDTICLNFAHQRMINSCSLLIEFAGGSQTSNLRLKNANVSIFSDTESFTAVRETWLQFPINLQLNHIYTFYGLISKALGRNWSEVNKTRSIWWEIQTENKPYKSALTAI